MKNNKIAFIVPGFTELTKQEKYRKIAEYFKEAGIEPVMVNIVWKRKIMSDYINEIIEKANLKPFIILGFSFGAFSSLIASLKIKPKYLILCSLSPYFKEDLPYLGKWDKTTLGKARFRDFNKYTFSDIAKKVKSKTYIIYGEKEYKKVIEKSKKAKRYIKNSELFIAPNAKHDINNLNYQRTIKEIILNL